MNLFVLILVSVLVVLIFASQVAGRLDRLHRRVSSARTMLWRRCNERYEVVSTEASATVAAVAARAKRAADQQIFSADHIFLESELTRLLQEENSSVATQTAQVRLQDARRMYNEAVRATLYVRSWRISRWLRLSGRATAPKYVDFDDSQLNTK